MHQYRLHSTGLWRSVDGASGNGEIAAASRRVVVDLKTQNDDTGGYLNKDHPLTSLPLDTAIHLCDLSGKVMTAAENAQPYYRRIWSYVADRYVPVPMGPKGMA